MLNVYRDHASAWSEDDVEACEILAAMGAAYILGATQQRASSTLTEQLQHALDARVVIEQAKGFLMSRDQVGSEEALAVLRQDARSDNRKLRDVAQELLDATEGSVSA
jgi:AmiR/NasT family two-component response regulator